ncbi:MAG: hypothetical protein E7058_01745 [Lentisphaerae bacterium]|nr:hypothetical protein [Lentisphaerota bacterium]
MNRYICMLLVVFAGLALRAEVLIDSVFTKNTANWYALKNFGTAKTENGMLKLLPGAKNELRLANWKRISPAECAGKTIKITAVAKGKGTLNGAFVLTVKSVSGGRSYPRFAGEAVVLGNDFVTVEHSLDLSKHLPISLEPRLELKGSGAQAEVKSIKVEVFTVEGAKLIPESSYTAYPAGSSGNITLKLQTNAGAQLQLLVNDSATPVKADSSGNAVLNLAKNSGITGYTIAGKGISCRIFTEAVAPAEFAALNSAAAKSSLTAPAKVLILGDSLSDFERGRNYVDQMSFYLNANRKDRVNFYNFGIGGDDIKRVTRRLNHHFDPKSADEYFQKRYADISKVKYTHIIVFLGQNDTKASSKSGYKTTFVPTEKWQEHYARLLALLKKQFPQAQIILCSPIHTNSARQEVIAAAILKRKDNVWKFGIEEHMEKYAATVKAAAAAAGAKYIDLYTPSKNHPQLKDLFVSDGVHLSPAGERFTALQILQHL